MTDAPDAFELSDDAARLDRDLVHRWLSEQAYWSLGRPREVQDAAIDSSRNFGVYRARTGQQVAYARVVTDGATFGWLCDVFVEERLRGQGLGSMLLKGVCATLAPLQLSRLLLATADAHEVYRSFGFEELTNPERYMARSAGRTLGRS